MCMGAPHLPPFPPIWLRVYPHVYGATAARPNITRLQEGLSPRVWGLHCVPVSHLASRGAIPRCMGPPPLPAVQPVRLRVYPHVYGATGVNPNITQMQEGLSPCVWGHHEYTEQYGDGPGSIPMCMGPPYRK